MQCLSLVFVLYSETFGLLTSANKSSGKIYKSGLSSNLQIFGNSISEKADNIFG